MIDILHQDEWDFTRSNWKNKKKNNCAIYHPLLQNNSLSLSKPKYMKAKKIHEEACQIYDFSNYKLRRIIECNRHPNGFKDVLKNRDTQDYQNLTVGTCSINKCDLKNHKQTPFEGFYHSDTQCGKLYSFHIQNNIQRKTKDLDKNGCKTNNDTPFYENVDSEKNKNNYYKNNNIEKTNTYMNSFKYIKKEKNNEIELYENQSCEQRCNTCNFKDNEDAKRCQQTTCINKIKEMLTALKTLNDLNEQQFRKRYINCNKINHIWHIFSSKIQKCFMS